MSDSKKTDVLDILLTFAMGVIAVFALKSFFDNDSSKIVSERGAEILSDPEELARFEAEYEQSKTVSAP